MKLSSREVLNKWVSVIREDKRKLYTSEDRQDHLETLMAYLRDNEIDMDEASTLKNVVVKTLVHSEGLKGNGRYKGWKETAEQDFDDWIQRAYVPTLVINKTSRIDYKLNPDIVEWAKSKFGKDISPQLMKDCHTIGNILNIMYYDDLMKEG